MTGFLWGVVILIQEPHEILHNTTQFYYTHTTSTHGNHLCYLLGHGGELALCT